MSEYVNGYAEIDPTGLEIVLPTRVEPAAKDHGIQELQELTGSQSSDRVELVTAYKALYERGWRTSRDSRGGAVEANGGPSPLERADDRNEPDAWYHGYDDYACDGAKWSAPHDKGLF